MDDRLREIFDEVRPDVIVEDNVVAFPAVPASGMPWVRIVSCNPLELSDPGLPPVFSGYPTGDRTGWDAFRAEYRERAAPCGRVRRVRPGTGAPALGDLEFIHESPWLDLVRVPARGRLPPHPPAQPTWYRLASSVRGAEQPFEVPEHLREGRRAGSCT